jgi:group I intron endonuclease
MIYSIYKVTNVINKKIYIGYTNNLKVRKSKHKRNSQRGCSHFYNAILKYGWDNFTWEVIYCSTDKNHCLNEMEPYFIKEYDSINSGYNLTKGGAGVIGVTKDKIWINDGKNHMRVNQNFIPSGWSKGRINLSRKIKMNEETKAIIGEKNKTHGSIIKLNAQIKPCPFCAMSLNPGQYNRHLRIKHSYY